MADEIQRAPATIQQAWDEHNLAKLKYFRSLSLYEKLRAVEGMADVVHHFEEMRRKGDFKNKA